MGKSKPITKAGRKRVQAAMDKHGMLLVQGQYDLPSLADLLEGAPITTRGYSHDYVPAWRVRWELEQEPDYVALKLFGGMNTIVYRRHWDALNALANAARKSALRSADGPALMLRLIEKNPGISGAAIKEKLGLSGKPGTRDFQRDKTKLEQWLCIEGREQEDLEYHTHDNAWFPWAQAKASVPTTLTADEAVRSLMEAVYGRGANDERATRKAFPVWAVTRR